MRVALDTNILAYAEGVNGSPRKKATLAFIEKLPADETFIPLQALGELFTVLVRKAGRTPTRARNAVLTWQDAYSSIETSAGVLASAMDLAAGHQLGIWDAIVLSAAAYAGCRYLLSEDLQDGFTWNGVTVVNPFAADDLGRVLEE
jgi:predicted nucleic acid-binding protein